MIIFEKFYRLNRIKIHTKTLQIAPFLKNFSGEHAPEPPNKILATHLALSTLSGKTLRFCKLQLLL